MTTQDAATRGSTERAAQVAADRPGFRRLGFGGGVLAIGSALFVWSLFLALLGIPALDFEFLFVQVASHPDPLVVNGVAIPTLVAVVGIAPIAALGIVGGGRLWLQWSSPRLALLASTAWLVLAVVLFAAGGDGGLAITCAILLAVIVSGAWARRREGATPLDIFLRGE